MCDINGQGHSYIVCRSQLIKQNGKKFTETDFSEKNNFIFLDFFKDPHVWERISENKKKSLRKEERIHLFHIKQVFMLNNIQQDVVFFSSFSFCPIVLEWSREFGVEKLFFFFLNSNLISS